MRVHLNKTCLINRAAIGQGGSRFTRCFFFSVSDVTRPRLPLGQTLHHATYDVYLPKAVETLVHRQCFWTLFSLLCVKYIFFWFKKGIIAISHTE